MSSRLSLLTVAAAAATIAMASAGCGQTTGLNGPTGVANASGFVSSPGALRPPRVTLRHAQGDKSWMNPAAKKSDLLYLDDETGDAYVYSYPKGELMGTLTGLGEPRASASTRRATCSSRPSRQRRLSSTRTAERRRSTR